MLRCRVLIACACLVACKIAAASNPTTLPADIPSLIQSLADPDPAVRQHAADGLAHKGPDARPQLLKASRSASPEIASRASEILLKLPWWKSTDPQKIQEMLVAYINMNNDQRGDLIDQIAREPGAGPVLLRLAQEDPSDAVAWRAERDIRIVGDEALNASIRKLDLTDARLPILALAARAFLPVDRARGDSLLHRLIEEDQADPTLDMGELDFAYRLLVADAIEAGDLHAAVGLLRQHVRQCTDPQLAQAATFDLFAFYADLGPTPDLDRDLDEFSDSLGRPEVMYAMARIADHGPDGSPLLRDMLSQVALASSLASPMAHYSVGETLSERCWNAAAARELYATIALKDQVDASFATRIEYFAQHRLAQVNENTDNHTLVADHAQRASELALQLGDSSDVDPVVALPQAYWHRLHAAREAHDEKAVQANLAKLMAGAPDDSDASIEVYATLMSQGKADEAKRYFETAYAASVKKLATMPNDPEEMNNLAWLCASCNQHVTEAIKYANQAVAKAPEVFAFIDTAAAANAAAGNFAEAARLEKRALAMRPADDYMRAQAEKYAKQARSSTTRSTGF